MTVKTREKRKLNIYFAPRYCFQHSFISQKKVKLFISFSSRLRRAMNARMCRYHDFPVSFPIAVPFSTSTKCRNWFCQSLLVISAEIRGRRLARQVDNEPPKMRCERKASLPSIDRHRCQAPTRKHKNVIFRACPNLSKQQHLEISFIFLSSNNLFFDRRGRAAVTSSRNWW